MVSRPQWVFRARNNLGLSVIPDRSRFEVAVIQFHGHGDDHFTLVYDTPITGDVLPGQTAEEVRGLCARVSALPHRPFALEG